MKKNQSFLSENFQFLEVKFSIYLNRHVFVMNCAYTVRIFSNNIYRSRSRWYVIINPHAFTAKQGKVKINVDLAHPYDAGKSCSKFGLIPTSGLGGDILTGGRTHEGAVMGCSPQRYIGVITPRSRSLYV